MTPRAGRGAGVRGKLAGMAAWQWSIHPSYEGLLRVIDEMNCGLVFESEEGLILYANQQVLEWSGFEAKELEGEHISILVPPELHDALESERKRVLGGDQRTRLSAFRRKDGRTFPIAVTPHLAERIGTEEPAVLSLLFDLGEVQAARPLGAPRGSLAAELAVVATKLQSLAFAAAMAEEAAVPLDHPRLRSLSKREREVLARLVGGSRVSRIASDLFISPNTVRNHLKSIYRKLDVSSQSELIDWVRSLREDARDDQGSAE